jgi:peptidyl-prolyl cis-trans isomerase C
MHWTLQTLIVGTLLSSPSLYILNVEAVVPEIEPGPEETISSEAIENPPRLADPHSFPEIVARVNDTPIQKQGFLERAASVQSDMGLPEGDLPLQIYRTILNEMVDMELLYQASQARNFRSGPDEIEQRYQALVARFPSEEAFLNQLTSRAMTSQQFKELMYRDMSVQKLIAEEFTPRVTVSDEAKLRFYNENREKMEQPEQLRLSHILTRVEPRASLAERELAYQKIRGIHEKVLQEGADFAAMAREFSEDPESKDKGGELLIKRGQTVPAFEEAAFGLEQGAVSEVVETRFGYHVIKLYERIPARTASYEDVESLIQEVLEQQELQHLIESEIKGLREEASVELFI